MKTILLIDLITDDRSLDFLEDVRLALGDQAEQLKLVCLHLPTQNVAPEDIDSADAIMLSGSTKSVYQDFGWKDRCHQLLDRIIRSGKPALATCFSAQFLALHLGGKVEKNAKGIEFGPIQIELTAAGKNSSEFRPFTKTKHLMASHRDCITGLPDNCRLLAFNSNSAVQAFSHLNILATQFHSDIPVQTASKLLISRKQQYLDEGVLANEQSFADLLVRLESVRESHQFLVEWLNLSEI